MDRKRTRIIVGLGACLLTIIAVSPAFAVYVRDELVEAEAAKYECVPEEIYKNIWQLVADNNYDRTFNGQNWDRWKDRYKGKLATNEDAYEAVDTMLASLGPPLCYSYRVSGEMCIGLDWFPKGIGILVGTDEYDRAMVKSVFADSTVAGKSLLLPSDVILEVDGKPTQHIPSNKVIDMIQGKPDSKVILTVLRAGKHSTVEAVRGWDRSPIGPVGMLDKKVGYINVVNPTDSRFIDRIWELLKHTLNDASGIIIDFRGTAESYKPRNVEQFCDLLLDHGVMVCEVDRKGLHEREAASGGTYRGTLVLLVDGTTCGASEQICAALQHNKGAILVGEQTAGWPRLQRSGWIVFHRFGFYLNTGEYLTPAGTPIKHGLIPDHKVSITESDTKSGRGPWWYTQTSLPRSKESVNDIQLRRAIDVLKEEVRRRNSVGE